MLIHVKIVVFLQLHYYLDWLKIKIRIFSVFNAA